MKLHINKDNKAKETLSKCLNINDKALEKTLRQILFDNDNRIDWNKANKIMLQNMPELQIKE